MEVFIFIAMFIFGTLLGSFYNVVGYRVPKGESLIYPGSHCPNCNHKLSPLELIPIFSYLFLGGKCKQCKKKISPFYMIFEFVTGLLFALAYLAYGLTPDIIIPLTFLSLLVIIVISDILYMIIPDSVLLVFGIILCIEILFINGLPSLAHSIIAAIGAFITMFLLKKLGDFLFKKESMGGGDIKLMALFGLVLGYPMSIFSIFLGSLIGFPISLITLKNNSSHIIPFGPFLALGATIIVLLQLDFNTFLNLYN